MRRRQRRVAFHSGDILPAIIQQESSGRVGALGPMTPYGQAQGLTQVLPSTGQGIAKRLNLPWRPDLMTAKNDAGAAYQTAIGGGYFDEALNKTGNVVDALKYYHGGPNRAMWGPKTQAYASNVLARLGLN